MKLLATFTVPGEPRGYTISLRPWEDRAKRYHDWCELARICAARAGLALPLAPTPVRRLWFVTWPHFKGSVHPDPENVHKGLKDALCYAGKKDKRKRGHGDDKWTGGIYPPPLYDAVRPRVDVWVYEIEASDDPLEPDCSS